MKTAVMVVAVALLLTGCAQTPEQPAASSSPSRTATPTAEPEVATALGLCEVMEERFLDYPDYVLAIANGEFDEVTHAQYVAWAEDMEQAAPTDARTTLSKFTDPIYQVQAVVEQGGGDLTFATDDYKAGSVEMLEYCVDAGFKVSD